MNFLFKKSSTFKGGKVHGMCVKSNEPALQLQASIVSSLQSSNKRITALCPVSNLTADGHLPLTQKDLAFLHNIGCKVISLISDKNRVSRNMFEKLCDCGLKSSIPNPCNSSETLFLVLDSVYLLKC